MSMKNNTIPVDLAIGIIGKWKETYRWIPIFGAFAAVMLAFAAGANNLPAPVGPLFFFKTGFTLHDSFGP